MITGLDHIVLIAPDIDEGVAAYETVIGHAPIWRAEDLESGVNTALFQVENTALELMAPAGVGPVADRLREMIDQTGPRLTSLAFSADDLADAHHTLSRRGLAPGGISPGRSKNLETGDHRTWQRFRCADAACAGIKTFILSPKIGWAPSGATRPAETVHGLDHIVIETPNPNRAIAQYGARLGLRFALDRTAPEWKVRFLFFRTGDLTLEIIHRLGRDVHPEEDDRLWGLTWAVQNLAAAHERLTQAGLELSDIRPGRKPETHVFTLRSGTLGIPTLFITHENR